MTSARLRLLIVLALLVVVVGVWYLLTALSVFSAFLLPSPSTVGTALHRVLGAGATYDALWLTVWEILAAFAIAVAAGLLVGLTAGLRSTTQRAYEPMLGTLAAVPLIVLYPVFMSVFGVGSASKVWFGAVTAFFPVALATINGVGAIDRTLLTASRAMGGRPAQLFRLVVIPAALPQIGNGLRLGIVYASLAVVGGEFIGGTGGLGHLLASAGQAFQTPDEYAYVVVTLALTIALQLVVAGLIRLSERGEHR
jgi:ABC-type nitrate/sulfonate/bicarbonate transport system permease component